MEDILIYYSRMANKQSKIRKEIGEKFRSVREKLGFTQVEVADKSGIDPSYYAQIERGEVNPTLDKLYSICKTLKIDSLNMP